MSQRFLSKASCINCLGPGWGRLTGACEDPGCPKLQLCGCVGNCPFSYLVFWMGREGRFSLAGMPRDVLCQSQWSIMINHSRNCPLAFRFRTEVHWRPIPPGSFLTCTTIQSCLPGVHTIFWYCNLQWITGLCSFETTGKRNPWEDSLWGPRPEMFWFLAAFLTLSLIFFSSLFFPVMASS